MSDGAAGLLQALLLVAALAVCYRPLGDYMARVFQSSRHLAVERAGYRLMGVDPDADQTWRVYLRSVLAFSAGSAKGSALTAFACSASTASTSAGWSRGTGSTGVIRISESADRCSRF